MNSLMPCVDTISPTVSSTDFWLRVSDALNSIGT
jgi:hypothetical protein